MVTAGDGGQRRGREEVREEEQVREKLTLDACRAQSGEGESRTPETAGICPGRPAAEVDEVDDARVDVGPPGSIPPVGKERRSRRRCWWRPFVPGRFQAAANRRRRRRLRGSRAEDADEDEPAGTLELRGFGPIPPKRTTATKRRSFLRSPICPGRLQATAPRSASGGERGPQKGKRKGGSRRGAGG